MTSRSWTRLSPSMTQHDPVVTLREMLDSCEAAVAVAGNLTDQQIRASLLHSLALPRALELIGEAATRLPADLRERYPDVSVQVRLTDSRPAHALIESSQRASLVIIGATGRGPSDAGRIGPVARRVVRDAQSAVMVVPSLAA